MALSKLDRANIAKVQSITSTPNSTTRGNIAINTSVNTLYFKSGSTWYSATGALGGVFEVGSGTSSAKRTGTTITVSGDYSFGMGSGGSVSGTASFAFGPSHSLASDYSIAVGANHAVASTANYSTVFGNSQTIIGISIGNTLSGGEHVANGNYNAIFGLDNDCADANNHYNLIAGTEHTMTSVAYSLIAGRNNDVQYGYGLTVGQNNENKEYYSIVYGQYATSIWEGARHFSGVRTDGSTLGSSMGLDGLVLTAQTISTSTVTMTLDSLDGTGTNPLYCPNGQAIVVGVRLVGISTGSNTGKEIYDFNLYIDRSDPTFSASAFGFDGGGTYSSPIFTIGANIGSIVVQPDGVNYKALIRVTGASGINTNWTAHLYKGICVKGTAYS